MNKLPTINIKGSQYVKVSDRVIFFNENYPNGYIQTELISDWNSDIVVVKAIVVPDIKNPERKFIDYAQEKIGDSYINKTSALENCSTSAVGRALAYMGIGVIDSIASVDEITKAENRQSYASKMPYNTNKYQKGKIIHPQTEISKVGQLKEMLFKAGAKDEISALELIEKKSGIKLANMRELTEEKASLIFSMLVEPF